MAVTGQNIIDKVHTVLSDVNIYWPDAELLGWLNSGLKEIAILKPNVLITIAAVKCVAGTKQTLPTGGLMLVDIVRNMGTAGTTPGRGVALISRQTLDGINNDWHTTTAAAVAKHFVFDPRYPKVFYVYPQQPAANQGYLEIAYAVSPTNLTALSDAIPLDDVYENVLVDYVLYRAFGKNSTEPSNVTVSQAHYAAFAGVLGAKVQAELAIQPVAAMQASSPPGQK